METCRQKRPKVTKVSFLKLGFLSQCSDSHFDYHSNHYLIFTSFQMLDMVRPEMGDKISLRDLKRCRMTPIFFDTFFNLEKYLDHEQRDPFASHRADDDGPEV